MRPHLALAARAAALLAAALLALGPPPAAASPVDLFGLGARAQAMAGAVLATTRGYEATYYNPAGLAFERRPSVALGFQSASFDLEVNGQPARARDASALVIGFSVPIPFGDVLEDRLTLGLAFTIPSGSILIADIKRAGTPSFIVLENRAQTVSVLGALGIRLTDELSIGVGALALASLHGAIRVEPGPSGALGTRVRDELRADYAAIVGVSARPTPWLDLALTWRQASTAAFELPITADLGDSFGIPLPELDVRGTAQYDPAEVAFEAAFRPTCGLVVAADVVWQRWSAFPLPLAYTAATPTTPPQPKPDLHDTVSLRLGAELDLPVTGDLHLIPRAGVSWEPSPVPEQTGLHNHLDGDRAVLALGVGVRWGSLRLDLAGQLHSVAERTSRKDPALVGAENAGYPSITSRGTVLEGSIELGVEL